MYESIAVEKLKRFVIGKNISYTNQMNQMNTQEYSVRLLSHKKCVLNVFPIEFDGDSGLRLNEFYTF